MAITLKTKVTLTTSIVVSTETVARFQKEREVARVLPAEKREKLKGQARAIYEAYVSEKSDEEVLQLVLRMGLREGLLETMKTEFNDGDFNAKGSQVAVTFKGRKQE